MSHSLSRRRFIQSAAAIGIGLPTILPSRVFAAPPSERLSFACIGIGGQMRGYLIPELGKIEQQIVAICDVDQRQIDIRRPPEVRNQRLQNNRSHRHQQRDRWREAVLFEFSA